MSEIHPHVRIGKVIGSKEAHSAVLTVADWLSFAAAPTFASMALLTGIHGAGTPGLLCSAMRDASPLSGMVPMYLLMSAFHFTPWLRLISRWRCSTHLSSPGTPMSGRYSAP